MSFCQHKITFSLALLTLALFLASCSETANFEEKQTEIEITGAAIAETEPAAIGCKHEDGSICSDECCLFEAECGKYRKCSLESGEWEDEGYDDASCSKICKKETLAKKHEATEEDRERTREMIEGFMESASQDPAKTCSEGWICPNSSWRAYRLSDCTLYGQIKCEGKCENSKCMAACDEGEKKCKGSKILICKDKEWGTYDNCGSGCEDGKCIQNEIIEFQNTSQETPPEETNPTNQSNGQEEEIQSCASDCIKFSAEESDFDGTVKCSTQTFDEYVSFNNDCSHDCILSGWALSDAQDTKFTFPEFILEPDSLVTVKTGDGASEGSTLFWGRCSAVWNNAGDTVYLRDNENNLIVEYTYP